MLNAIEWQTSPALMTQTQFLRTNEWLKFLTNLQKKKKMGNYNYIKHAKRKGIERSMPDAWLDVIKSFSLLSFQNMKQNWFEQFFFRLFFPPKSNSHSQIKLNLCNQKWKCFPLFFGPWIQINNVDLLWRHQRSLFFYERILKLNRNHFLICRLP